jgi:hypothetical protein
MGLKGNLCCGEIVEQLVHATRVTPIRNIVFMVGRATALLGGLCEGLCITSTTEPTVTAVQANQQLTAETTR